MTYYAGDDSTKTVPVIDTNGGPLTMDPAVVAHNSAGDELTLTATWKAAAAPLDDPARPGATFRDIVVPLVAVPRGLWGFVLTVDGGEDVFLFNEVIQ